MNIAFAIPGFSTDPNSAEGQSVRKAVDKCARAVGKKMFAPGAVVFTIDRAFSPRASDQMNAAALEMLLECLCTLDQIWVTSGRQHTELYSTPVYYARTVVWDTIPALYGRGFGDCKSLTACVVAELRARGIWCRPTFRFKTGSRSTMFHILVMFADGTFDDPSKHKGMLTYQEEPETGQVSAHGFFGGDS